MLCAVGDVPAAGRALTSWPRRSVRSSTSSTRRRPQAGSTCPRLALPSSRAAWEVARMSSKRLLELRLGSVTVDVPRTLGYYGGVAAAVGLGLAEPPLAVFIAAVPLMKLLTHRALPGPVRAVGEFLEGASKPVGGDAEAVFGLVDQQRDDEEAREV